MTCKESYFYLSFQDCTSPICKMKIHNFFEISSPISFTQDVHKITSLKLVFSKYPFWCYWVGIDFNGRYPGTRAGGR